MFHRRNEAAANCSFGFMLLLGCCSFTFNQTASAQRGSSDGVLLTQPMAGQPLRGLTPQQMNAFLQGQTLYNTPLTVAHGLGPVFNKNSCGNCHNNPLGGTGAQTVTRFGRENKGVFDPMAEFGGSLLQVSSISQFCFEEVPVEATITQQRVTNGALAYGLVESIPDAALLANRDVQPLTMRGVAHMVGAFEDKPKDPLRVGRFGWKAQVATVLTFSADAALNEMGLTNRFITVENDPNGDYPPALAGPDFCDTITDPEDGPDSGGLHFIDHITNFQRMLAPFPQTPKSGMTGEVVFNTIGCNVCHTPSFTTSDDSKLEDVLRNRTIRPYSDFLLHEMGTTGDPIVQGDAYEQTVKTPPLWGIVIRDPMWHDGRIAGGTFADRMNEAIQLHRAFGSQAKTVGDAYDVLPQQAKDQLIAFLASLGQPEFDSDLNMRIDLDDFTGMTGGVGFRACFGAVTPDMPCAIHDIDQDGDVDFADFSSFMTAYVGPRRDCNGNGQLDLSEILAGTLVDNNGNGIADSCEPTCDSDVNGNATVNVSDLLAIISQWGPCPAPTQPCSGDVTADGLVNVADLLAVIMAWGPCFP